MPFFSSLGHSCFNPPIGRIEGLDQLPEYKRSLVVFWFSNLVSLLLVYCSEYPAYMRESMDTRSWGVQRFHLPLHKICIILISPLYWPYFGHNLSCSARWLALLVFSFGTCKISLLLFLLGFGKKFFNNLQVGLANHSSPQISYVHSIAPFWSEADLFHNLA